MSRSGYDDNFESSLAYLYRGRVASAIRGKRGQDFLRDLLAALDAMPEKRLIADVLEDSGEVCAIGALGRQRGLDMSSVDPEDDEAIANFAAPNFNIAEPLAREVVYENDEGCWGSETPEQRYARMHKWVSEQLIEWETP